MGMAQQEASEQGTPFGEPRGSMPEDAQRPSRLPGTVEPRGLRGQGSVPVPTGSWFVRVERAISTFERRVGVRAALPNSPWAGRSVDERPAQFGRMMALSLYRPGSQPACPEPLQRDEGNQKGNNLHH